MQQCLHLAAKGLGTVAPNPLVGCVIVQNGAVLATGYHQQYGGPHAEVNAIDAVADKSLLKDCTLYVNLEPCAHYGKTPPCAGLIAEMQIPRVVVGALDPNPLVAGKGVEILRAAGCEVTVGVLPQACRQLNRRFSTWIEQKRPFVLLKWAKSSDGFIDAERSDASTPPVWITGPDSKRLVHQWRSEEPGILVGGATALLDNPRLNVREVEGANPTRIVLDTRGDLPPNLHLLDGTEPTIVFSVRPGLSSNKLEYVAIDTAQPLIPQVLAALYVRDIQTVMVEGGRHTLQQFIDANLWDEARVFTGNKLLHAGLPSPTLNAQPATTMHLGADQLEYYYNAH